MQRGGKKSFGLCPFDDAASIHHVDFVTGLMNYGKVVGDENDGGSQLILTIFDEVQNLFLDGDIKGCGWFITDQ